MNDGTSFGRKYSLHSDYNRQEEVLSTASLPVISVHQPCIPYVRYSVLVYTT